MELGLDTLDQIGEWCVSYRGPTGCAAENNFVVEHRELCVVVSWSLYIQSDDSDKSIRPYNFVKINLSASPCVTID